MTESELNKSKPTEIGDIAIIATIQQYKSHLSQHHFGQNYLSSGKSFLFDTSTNVEFNHNTCTALPDPSFFENLYQSESPIDKHLRRYLETIWQLFESAGLTRSFFKKNYGKNVVFYTSLEPNFAADTHLSYSNLSNSKEYKTLYKNLKHHVSQLFDLPSSCFLNECSLPTSINSSYQLYRYLLEGNTQIAIVLGVSIPQESDKLKSNIHVPGASPWAVMLSKLPEDHKTNETPVLAIMPSDSFRNGKSDASLTYLKPYSTRQIPQQTNTTWEAPELIVLSANTPQALQLRASLLLSHIMNNMSIVESNDSSSTFIKTENTISLQNLAYTLQCGREAMSYRLAMVVNNLDELLLGIAQFLVSEGETTTSVQTVLNMNQSQVPVNLYRGYPNSNNQFQTLLSGSSGETMIKALIQEGDLNSLALYWTKGGDILWREIKREITPNKIHLPVYPFYIPSTCTHPNAEHAPLSSKITIDSVEADLTTIWQQLLGRPQIGRHQNFFEVGGDSQLGMHMLSMIRNTMNADLPLNSLYETQTIAKMSEKIVLVLARSSSNHSQEHEYEEGIIV